MHWFIQEALLPETRFHYFAWILVVVVSIVLHELAHGWMAIRRGDDTPIREGRMTGNPLVHMGPFSLVALFLVGMAWGRMPIDPSRMRGRYAEAAVAAAGPAMNLLIAVVALVALGLLLRFHGRLTPTDPTWLENLYTLLSVAGTANIVLAIFNLFPVPPLDGSHILANFSRKYALFADDPSKQGFFFLAFAFVFVVSSAIWPLAGGLAMAVVGLVAG